MSLYLNFFSTVIAAVLFQGFITSHPNCRRKERRVWVAEAGRKEGRREGRREKKERKGLCSEPFPDQLNENF